MRKGAVFFCVFLIAVAGYAVMTATRWSFTTKLFPLSVAIPLLILATVQLVLIVTNREATETAGMDVEFSTDVPADVARRRVFGIFAWIIFFILLVYLVGFPLTVPLFVFLYLRFQSAVNWLAAIVATVITWACFYLLFQSFVHIQFEAGAIQTWLGM